MKIPQHIGFIMDGNGRWAQARGLPRSAGHKAGYEHIPEVLEICQQLGIQFVSGFAWSTENWNRPKPEVDYIMQALENQLPRFVKELDERGIRFIHSGTIERLSKKAVNVLREGVKATAFNSSGTFNLAFNYGGRAELVDAVRTLIEDRVPVEEVSLEMVESKLWTAELPDVDLVIRTGGDFRQSNFMLWKSAFSCIYIAGCYWPAITRKEIEEGIAYFSGM
jgi:undecaprenyl diphosphate synthase